MSLFSALFTWATHHVLLQVSQHFVTHSAPNCWTALVGCCMVVVFSWNVVPLSSRVRVIASKIIAQNAFWMLVFKFIVQINKLWIFLKWDRKCYLTNLLSSILLTLVGKHLLFDKIKLVWLVPPAQVLACPQLIFPSQNLVFWNLFKFSAAEITYKSIFSHILNPNLTK
jgi:hypothetical protein